MGDRQVTAAPGACRRQRRIVLLVDVCGDRPMRASTIGRPGLPAGTPRRTPRETARERRRLAMQLTPCLVEIVFEPINLFPQLIAIPAIAIAIPIRALMLAPQPLVLALQPLEFGDQFLAGGGVPSRVHAPVMARLKNLYKYKRLSRRRRYQSLAAATR
jgi:hypothetical protein